MKRELDKTKSFPKAVTQFLRPYMSESRNEISINQGFTNVID
jgi:hypothetical protein